MEKKTIVLMVSKYFPAYHPRAGEETGFADKILSGDKLHTIRGNYDLWKKRADEINSGKVVLSMRYWTGKAYRSKQVEIHQLNKIGVQKLKVVDHGNFWFMQIFDPGGTPKLQNDCIDHSDCKHDMWFNKRLANNDGLCRRDFFDWFKPYDLSQPMAIIHFTDFRY